jgi:isopentenyl diphosphate isomerase/L-lactate dehydrogenase-like FMN-dependent dehydrogenase
MGVDGVIISNHGGRQFDRALTALQALPAIKRTVGDRLVTMLDGGIRRASDVVTALCLGARFVFTGRATLYDTIASGDAGVRRARTILGGEVNR